MPIYEKMQNAQSHEGQPCIMENRKESLIVSTNKGKKTRQKSINAKGGGKAIIRMFE